MAKSNKGRNSENVRTSSHFFFELWWQFSFFSDWFKLFLAFINIKLDSLVETLEREIRLDDRIPLGITGTIGRMREYLEDQPDRRLVPRKQKREGRTCSQIA